MDREQVGRFQAGQRDVLEQIYWENIDQIEALVRACLVRAQRFSVANLTDLVQDVFAKAFSPKARAAYDGEREYGPFLRQLARNTLVDWLRRGTHEILAPVDFDRMVVDEPSVVEEGGGPFAPDLVALAQRFVLALDPELKAVHERRFVAAESQDAAARALGISRQNLRTLERRLLDSFRREVRQLERDERPLSFPQPNQRAKPY